MQEFYDKAAQAQKLGFEVVKLDDQDQSWLNFFLFPKSTMGTLIQIGREIKTVWPPDISAWNQPLILLKVK